MKSKIVSQQLDKIEKKTWQTILTEWNDGIYPKYLLSSNSRFIYETSVCTKDKSSEYKYKIIRSSSLNNPHEQDYSSFKKIIMKHIETNKNNYVMSFYNLNKDTKLIIPIPKKNKNFATIKDFMCNASKTQQIKFWKHVVKEINLFLLNPNNDRVFVSTHGHGVHYFHMRLCNYPKYYLTSEFREE